MTSGGPLPSGTLTGVGGIEAWGQKTGDEYKQEMYQGVAVPANKTSAFSNGIPGVIGFFIDALVSALVMGLKGITGGLIDLTGALKATDTKADNANANANTAINIVTTVQQQVTAFDVKTNRPIGETITPLGYGPFAHSQLVMLGVTETDTVNPPDSGVHSHQIPYNRNPAKSFTNTTIISFIRLTADDAIKLMYFYAAGAPTSLVARFYRMNAAGDLTELLGTSANIAGNILSTFSTQLVTFPDEALGQTGDYIAMALTVQGTVTVAGIDAFAPAPIPGFNPIKKGAVLATTAPSSTVSQSAMDFTSGWVTYMEASRSIGQELAKRSLVDLYDRPDADTLGNSYSVSGSTNRVGIRTNAATWFSLSDGYAHALHTTPLTTTKTHGRITVGSVNASASERFAGAVMRSTANRTSWGGLFFDNNEYSIVRGTGPNTFSKLRTLSVTPVSGDVLEWDLTGARWVVKRNGIVVVDEDFPTITYGPANLYEGVYLSRSSFQSSGSIADWMANDVSDVI